MTRAPEVLGKHYEIAYPGRQWASARDLRRTPLHGECVAAKACFGQFFGWERPLYFAAQANPPLTFGRPVWFEQVGCEVAFAHGRAAIFDQSTFGKIAVSGPDAENYLNRLCANDMSRSPGSVIYTAMLNQAGGLQSDLTVLRISDQHYLLYIGTGAVARGLFRALRNAGAKPAGVYAQTSMRIEKRFLAVGHELDGDVTPAEAGLGFAVKTDANFIGRDAYLRRLQEGPKIRLVSVLLENPQAVPLGDEPVYDGDRCIGQATSASYGYRVQRPVALAYRAAEAVQDKDCTPVSLDLAGVRMAGNATLQAAYDPDGIRMRLR